MKARLPFACVLFVLAAGLYGCNKPAEVAPTAPTTPQSRTGKGGATMGTPPALPMANPAYHATPGAKAGGR